MLLQVAHAMESAFEDAVSQLMQERKPLSAAIVTELADRCSAGLSQLRGITAMYRMSARPAPTRSAFIQAFSFIFFAAYVS